MAGEPEGQRVGCALQVVADVVLERVVVGRVHRDLHAGLGGGLLGEGGERVLGRSVGVVGAEGGRTGGRPRVGAGRRRGLVVTARCEKRTGQAGRGKPGGAPEGRAPVEAGKSAGGSERIWHVPPPEVLQPPRKGGFYKINEQSSTDSAKSKRRRARCQGSVSSRFLRPDQP